MDQPDGKKVMDILSFLITKIFVVLIYSYNLDCFRNWGTSEILVVISVYIT